LGGYAKYTHEINDELDVYGRVGLLYASAEWSCSGTWCTGSSSDTDTGMSFGAGINYEFSDQMDFTAGYTDVADGITHMSAGIKYKM